MAPISIVLFLVFVGVTYLLFLQNFAWKDYWYKDSWELATISSDGNRIALESQSSKEEQNKLQIRDLESGRILYTHTYSDNDFLDIGSIWYPNLKLPTLKRFISAQKGDNKIRVWDVENGRLLHTLQELESPIEALKMTPDEQKIVSLLKDGTLQAWDLESGNLLNTQKPPNEKAFVLPDPSIYFPNDYKAWVELNLITPKFLYNIFTPDNKKASLRLHDGSLKIVDLDSKKTLFSLTGNDRLLENNNRVSFASIKINDKQLVTLKSTFSKKDSGTIKTQIRKDEIQVWDWKNNRLLYALDDWSDNESSVI